MLAPSASSATKTLVQLSEVGFHVEGKQILDQADVCVDERQFVGIIGPNGGGKTTLLKLILGLLKPTAGHVSYAEKSLQMGYVPQYTAANQRMPITVGSVVAMGLYPKLKRSQRHHKDRILQALSRLQIEHLVERQFDTLSGGQKQRTLIARALVCDPQLLLFDEPTANIDPTGTYCFYELLDQLRGQLSVVLVSHELSVLANYFDSLICVNQKVIQSQDGQLSQEMSQLLFGAHTVDCPMDCYIRDFTRLVGVHQHHDHH